MEKRLILTLLIRYYKRHLNYIKDNPKYDTVSDVKDYLDMFYLSNGICFCAHKVFMVDVYSEDWVIAYKPNSSYWCARPDIYNTLEDIYTSLQTRISIMEKMLEDDNVRG